MYIVNSFSDKRKKFTDIMTLLDNIHIIMGEFDYSNDNLEKLSFYSN